MIAPAISAPATPPARWPSEFSASPLRAYSGPRRHTCKPGRRVIVKAQMQPMATASTIHMPDPNHIGHEQRSHQSCNDGRPTGKKSKEDTTIDSVGDRARQNAQEEEGRHAGRRSQADHEGGVG